MWEEERREVTQATEYAEPAARSFPRRQAEENASHDRCKYLNHDGREAPQRCGEKINKNTHPLSP